MGLKARMQPHWATSVGIRGHDRELATYTQRTVGQSLRKIFHLKRVLNSFGEDSLSISGWVDRELLLADMETYEFWFADQVMWRRSPLPYTDAIIEGAVNLLLSGEEDSLSAHLASRLAAIPGVIADAEVNVTDPIWPHCEVAYEDLRKLERFLNWERLRAHPAIDTTYITAELIGATYEALARFMDPVQGKAFRCEWHESDFALGVETYCDLLRREHRIEQDLVDLVAEADRALAQARSKLDELGWPDLEPGVSVGADYWSTAMKPLEPADMNGYGERVSATLRRLDEFLPLTRLPEDALVDVRVLPCLDLVLGEALYWPPGVSSEDRAGKVYLMRAGRPRPAQADFSSWRHYKPLNVYYPAEHLLLVRTLENGSFVRTHMRSHIARDGYTLYFREMEAARGHGGVENERKLWADRAFYAASLIADVKLHTGEFSVEEAANFLRDAARRPHDMAFIDAQRYAVAPGSGIGYLMGRNEILRLRERYESLKRNSFDLKEFHDTLLSCGYLPPYLVSIEVMSKGMGRE